MVCEKEKCTGCFACYNICPKNAIEMIEDNNGYIYPEINEGKCIGCNLCKKICPSINKVKNYDEQKCYAMYSKDENIRANSTSGGIATTLSKAVIQNGGVVYGASYTQNCSVQHIRVTDLKKLEDLQGSKYVHSYINDIFKNVKEDLGRNISQVLFIGTPCQIAGLKKYLGKDYENLIFMDIICHGVPSQKYLKEEVQRLTGTLEIDRVNFRDGNKYGFYIQKKSQIIYGEEKIKSPYCDAFMRTLSLRENCYNCLYATPKRISDITIGDFWGLGSDSKFYGDRECGVSTVIISTDKGKKFIERYKDKFDFEERPYDESVNGNTQLMRPTFKDKMADKFKQDCEKYGFYKSYKKCSKLTNIKRTIKRKIKSILKRDRGE